MSKTAWKPWHQVVELQDELKLGELTQAIFAADLCDVVLQRGKRQLHEDPAQFFELTYPTQNLLDLAKDVLWRLAGRTPKAVRQLELTYGGGKTHALITLYHLVHQPTSLPDHIAAVQEFKAHIGIDLPQARISTLTFDRLDTVRGLEVKAPDGSIRRFLYPWTVLAFQLGGQRGLELLGMTDDTERETPPLTNVLEDVLSLPEQEGLSSLILIDEVLMWARTKAGENEVWRGRLQDFFQCLTQAAVRVDRCAIVASLLAADPKKNDPLGKKIASELYAVFRREGEAGILPVAKDDVANILRRQLFKAESIRDTSKFRPQVLAALQGIYTFDEETRKEGSTAEERFLKSYPFHPDLTEVFYTKWTQLESFQRARGVLRTFAMALQDAVHWDNCPLIGTNVFLGAPRNPGDPPRSGLSDAATELTGIASSDEYEGKKIDWSGILEGELTKAQDIQFEAVGIEHREVEQAVFATFLHSQPIGQQAKALTQEVFILVGQTKPDRIDLQKALLRWKKVSWFLDEDLLQEVEAVSDTSESLPKAWRLGPKPNLTQMHDVACRRVTDLIEPRLISEIGKLKTLTAGASGAGIKVHTLPPHPKDISDDDEFHFAILGPKAASLPNRPSPEAKRFIEETTGADKPRVHRNGIILAVPSPDGLEAAREAIRQYIGWEEVRTQLQNSTDQELDSIRLQRLNKFIDDSRKEIAGAIQQAYSIVITVSDKNEIQAFKVTVGDDNLFNLIKQDTRSRIKDTAINAESLVPGGPYDLWREEDPARRVKDLVGAFAQFPRLPKMLNSKAILDTLVTGCEEGLFVLQLTRPDRSLRTFWRETPDDAALKDSSLEVVLPEKATLAAISPALLLPGKLPELWQNAVLSLEELYHYFSGVQEIQIQRDGYTEPAFIPKAAPEVVNEAIASAVKMGKLWLTSGPASILSEPVPAGLLTTSAQLQLPPQSISILDILPTNLPDSWNEGITTALALSAALSHKFGQTLPWSIIRDVIDGACKAQLLERTPDSGSWPCDYGGAGAIKLRLPDSSSSPSLPTVTPNVADPAPPAYESRMRVAEAVLQPNQLQDLADQIGDIAKVAVGLNPKFTIRIELGESVQPSDEVIDKINQLLKDVSDDLQFQ
jgi:hypothetical protein